MRPDRTITEQYRGFTRWTTWHKRPAVTENKILFWPKVEKLTLDGAVQVFRREISHALNEIGKTGRWTVHIDEGLFVTSPHFLGLADMVGMMYQLMRSSKGTILTLAQRPAHLPVSIYPNLSHAFVGRASELPDLKRLADMDGTSSSRELQALIRDNGKHDFVWIPIGQEWAPERVNFTQ
jgi:hypothetical protein